MDEEQKKDNTALKGLVKDLFDSSNQGRKKHEMRWYLADNFYENNHFVKQLNALGTLEPIKFPTGIKVRPVPRAKKQLHSLVNIVLSQDPRWSIYPRPEDGTAGDNYETIATRMGQWFQDLWYYLDVKDQVRKLVSHGFKYGVGYAEVGADEKGDIFIDVYEPYDIWHEPGISDLKETSYLIKGVSRTLQYVRDAKTTETQTDPETGEQVQVEVPLYNAEETAKLKSEERLSLAEWKNIRLQANSKGINKKIEDPRVSRVFLKEIWLKDGETWKLITECQGRILREVDTEFTELPFVAYKPYEGLLYQTSPFDDLIPLNQAIDIQLAMLEGYTRTTAVARLLKPKMTKISKVLNEHGEIIEWDGPAAPEWMQPGPAPASSIQMLQTAVNMMDEIGTSVVSFGKVPAGVKAAQALESLKSIEYSNSQSSIDLLARALEEIAERILDLADRYFKDPITVYHLNQGRPDFFKLVSQNSISAENPQSEAIPVSSKYMVKVEIESGTGYSEEGKRETMMQLFQAGLMPGEEVLKAFKYSNVGEILEKLTEEKAQQTSIVQTPEFNNLPPEQRLQILQSLGVSVDENVKAKIPLNLLTPPGTQPVANQPQPQ